MPTSQTSQTNPALHLRVSSRYTDRIQLSKAPKLLSFFHPVPLREANKSLNFLMHNLAELNRL